MAARSLASPWVGPAALAIATVAIIAIGAGWVSGPLSWALAGVLLASVVALVVAAIAGGPEVRRALAPYGLLKPGVLWLALFFIAPLWSMFAMSLSEKESRFTLDAKFTWKISNYSDAFSDNAGVFGRSFLYAGIATLLCIAIGYPLAYLIAFRGGRWRNVLLAAVVVPFFTSYLIRTLAWKSILADRGPVLGAIKRVPGLLDVLEWSPNVPGINQLLPIIDNGRLLSTPAAVIGGLTYNFLPFMVLPIYVSLEKIDARLIDAARDLYSTSGRAFRKVVLPLSLPGVFAGSLLCFIPAAGDFVNAEFLGSPRTQMIGNVVQGEFLTRSNYPTAAALSFILMAVITAGVLVYAKVLGTEELT